MDFSSGAEEPRATPSSNKYKGIRRRKWGKWVSEIRVPGTRDRLWLGSFSSAEAAAFAHDVAFYCLHRPPSLDSLNFPHMLPPALASQTSPRSIQRAASDAGMALDAQIVLTNTAAATTGSAAPGDTAALWEGSQGNEEGEPLSISVYDYLNDDSF